MRLRHIKGAEEQIADEIKTVLIRKLKADLSHIQTIGKVEG